MSYILPPLKKGISPIYFQPFYNQGVFYMKQQSASRITLISLSIIAIVIGMVISAFMLSRFMLKVQTTTEKSITVKGVAEK